jgi:hypothetical protein
VHTKKEVKVFPYPVSAVSQDGTKTVRGNFSRLRITRAGYGYGGDGKDARKDSQFPADDVLFILDFKTVLLI